MNSGLCKCKGRVPTHSYLPSLLFLTSKSKIILYAHGKIKKFNLLRTLLNSSYIFFCVCVGGEKDGSTHDDAWELLLALWSIVGVWFGDQEVPEMKLKPPTFLACTQPIQLSLESTWKNFKAHTSKRKNWRNGGNNKSVTVESIGKNLHTDYICMAVNKLQGKKETNQGVYSKQGNIVK